MRRTRRRRADRALLFLRLALGRLRRKPRGRALGFAFLGALAQLFELLLLTRFRRAVAFRALLAIVRSKSHRGLPLLQRPCLPPYACSPGLSQRSAARFRWGCGCPFVCIRFRKK